MFLNLKSDFYSEFESVIADFFLNTNSKKDADYDIMNINSHVGQMYKIKCEIEGIGFGLDCTSRKYFRCTRNYTKPDIRKIN